MIDQFDYSLYPEAIIVENVKTKKKWDIEENRGFVQGLINGRIYKFLKKHNDQKVLQYLNFLENYLYILKEEMIQKQYICYGQNCQNESLLFIKTPCTLQEIPHDTVFEGINKPKNIVIFSGDGLRFKKDNDYRAGRRHIMLSLRTKTGRLRPWTKVKKLFLHELAHTLCNHVTYREEGNHEDDFVKAENFLNVMVQSSPRLLELEKLIENRLFS